MTVILTSQSAGAWENIALPGDKSVAQRALLCAALATGTSTIRNVPDSDDVRATLACLQALGMQWRGDQEPAAGDPANVPAGQQGRTLRITGCGGAWPAKADCPVGASGTMLRLLTGLLAAGAGSYRLRPDVQLAHRPMQPVADALAALGACVELVRWGSAEAAVLVHGRALTGTAITLPEPSAQLKSAVLLAALQARGPSDIIEPIPTRDHLERMLPQFGTPVLVREYKVPGTPEPAGRQIRIEPGRLHAATIDVPGDPSAAAFWAVGAILRGMPLTLSQVGANPLRTGWVRALARMLPPGCIHVLVQENSVATGDGPVPCAEPVATLSVVPGPLCAVEIAAGEMPALLDELPILAVAAACARGVSRFAGIGRLRQKESDRVAAICALLQLAGRRCTMEADETVVIYGDPAAPVPLGELPITHDHRIVMAAAMLALRGTAGAPLTVYDAAAVTKSYPGFWDQYGQNVIKMGAGLLN